MHHVGFKDCGGNFQPLSHIPPRFLLIMHERDCRLMSRRMPRPEDVSHDHIDTTVMSFLKGEKDADWTEIALVTLHPREEIKVVLREKADRYRSIDERRFYELLARLRTQGVPS